MYATTGLSQKMVQKLQLVQNVAAHVVAGSISADADCYLLY